MSETKHSPEPWLVGNRDGDPSFPDEIDDATGFRCASAYGHGNSRHPDETAEAKARRIVACVNACAGIPTEALEAGALPNALEYGAMCAVGDIDTSLGIAPEMVDLFRILGRLP